jgi:hypothetical protein
MTRKTFAINVVPHEIVIGETELLLEPEVLGAEFADAYAALKEVQGHLTDAGDNISPDLLKDVNGAMRSFIHGFLLPESRPVFEGLKLPDRILVAVLEHVAELYGGGSQGNDDGGPSSAS